MGTGTRILNSIVIFLYRASGGRVANKMERAPIMLLTTIGSRTGKPRTNPVLFIVDGADLATVASAGGSDRNPAWFVNLMHNPEATVRIKNETRRVKARMASPEEKERLWPLLAAAYHRYDSYQKKTKRQIPVVILSPDQ